jgi:hypothetical protein
VGIDISIPDLQAMLIMHSYYIQYKQYMNGAIDMTVFFEEMKKTDSFPGYTDEKINDLFILFSHLLPHLEQIKTY